MPSKSANGSMVPVQNSKLFHGWIVVTGAFLVMFLSFGSAYSFTAFMDELQRQFSASRGAVSLVFSLAGFLYFMLGTVSGPLADRFGPRRIIALGMLIVGLGLMLASQATELWQVYAGYGFGIGVGVGFAYVPAIGAVQPWFQRRRGLASGIAVSGIGLGTLLVPPLAAALIIHIDWRAAYLVLGVVSLLGGMAAALLIEKSPAARGLHPDGAAAPVSPAGGAAGDGFNLAAAVRSAPFRLLYAGGLAASLGLFVPFVHLVPYAQDHGIDKSLAIWLLSLIGVGSTVGRFALGGLADRLGRRRALMAMYGGMALMLLWWLVAVNFWQLAIFAVVFGTCYGGFVALMPALVMDYFGGRSVSGIIGVLYSSVAFGTLLGPSLAGVAFDLLHSYHLPIACGVVAALAATGSVLFLPEPKRP